MFLPFLTSLLHIHFVGNIESKTKIVNQIATNASLLDGFDSKSRVTKINPIDIMTGFVCVRE